jgi:hypothetical protein
MYRHAILGFVLATVLSATAEAQSAAPSQPPGATAAGDSGSARKPETDKAAGAWLLKGRFLVGATRGVVETLDSDVGRRHRLSPFFRWNSRRAGWGPSFGFSAYEVDLSVRTSDGRLTVGSLSVRPVMAGVGYSVVSGRLRASAGVVAGYSFNKVTVDRAMPAGVGVDVAIDHTWSAGPRVGAVLALAPRLALVGSAGYTFSQPTATVTVRRDGQPTSITSDRLRAHAFDLRIGAAVSLF